MGLRIKELCKEKGVSMTILAEKLGITSVSLSQCLSGNPTIKRLQEIADALGVDFIELFEQPTTSVQGCIFVGGEPHIIKSKDDLIKLIENI